MDFIALGLWFTLWFFVAGIVAAFARDVVEPRLSRRKRIFLSLTWPISLPVIVVWLFFWSIFGE